MMVNNCKLQRNSSELSEKFYTAKKTFPCMTQTNADTNAVVSTTAPLILWTGMLKSLLFLYIFSYPTPLDEMFVDTKATE